MKKFLPFFYSTIIIVVLANSYSYGQRCNGNGQNVNPVSYNICVNSSNTFQIDGQPNYLDDCDEYGWCDQYWYLSDITVKRPDGSTALVISETMLSDFNSWYVSYTFPAGFFNVVGNWDFSYLSEDYCSGSNYTASFIVKVVGTNSNSIGSVSYTHLTLPTNREV